MVAESHLWKFMKHQGVFVSKEKTDGKMNSSEGLFFLVKSIPLAVLMAHATEFLERIVMF